MASPLPPNDRFAREPGVTPSVLIVDDVPANLLALEGALEPLSVRVVRATSGTDALRRLLEDDFDCVLLDVQMPGLDGFETLKLIRGRERTRHVPIIFMSASSRQKEEILRGYSEGAVDYIIKPFNPELLRARVSALIEQGEYERRRRRALQDRVRSTEADLAEARAQTLLRAESERARLYSLFLHAPFPVAVLRGGRLELELVNSAAAALFGTAVSVGRSFDDVDCAFVRAGGVDKLRAALNDGEPYTEREWRVQLDGRDAYFSIVLQPTRVGGGPVDGVLMCAFDVTEQVRGREEAKAAVKLRDEFLTVAAHELKTPLTPLLIRLEAIARLKKVEAKPVRHQVAAARGHVQRLARLVDSLLDVTRLSEGKLFLEPEPDVDIAALARDVVDRHQPAAAEAGCALTLKRADEAKLWTDRQRVEQVLTNLLSNALKYGAGKPVDVAVERDGAVVRFAVTDAGIGIAPEALMRIFGKFERAVSERHYGGLGLGLFISKEIVQALGGKISVTGAPGEGATFTVELPIKAKPD